MKIAIYSLFLLCLFSSRSGAQTYQVLSGSYSDRTFESDTTYFISNNVTLNGTTYVNGGAVIKFAANKSLTVNDSIVCSTSPYHPAIFTAKDDNGAGEPIDGSTGTPTNYYAAVALQLTLTNVAALSNLWFAHAHIALACREDIDTPEVTNVLQHLQFVHCAQGLWVAGAADIAAEPPEESFRSFPSEDDNLTNWLFLQNSLFRQVNHVITGQTAVVVAENVTVDRATALVSGNAAALAEFWPVVYCYNSVFAQVTNLTAGNASLSGGYNGFYHSPMFGGPTNGVSVYPFASDGWNDHYLTNGSPFVDDGDITATAAGLDACTTQTNHALDTGTVDLGWHYPVLLNLAAQCNTNGAGIALHWSLTDLIDDNFVHGYEIYRRTTPGAFAWNDLIHTTEPYYNDLFYYVDVGAVPGQTYHYAVVLLHFTDQYDVNNDPIYCRLPYPATVSATACCPVDNGTNLWVNYGYPAAQLAQWLMGTNPVTVQNASYTGAAAAIGIFGNGNGVGLNGHQFPFDTGVVLSSGRIANALGPNDDNGLNVSSELGEPGDADLNGLVDGGPTTNATVLEFDLVATNSFTLTFHYTFASEEYPEWIASPPDGFNDPMAIFVTTNRAGTNWIITTNNNIALIPGTADVPVSVYTINGGYTNEYYQVFILPSNPQHYLDNHDPKNYPYYSSRRPPYSSLPPYAASVPVYNLQYDGFTSNLVAQINITAAVTNHIKVTVADYNDERFDSAVFIKAQITCP